MRSSDLLIDNKSIPVEYPNNPDVQLDGNALVFKERGLRGQPGSAPPFDLGKSTRALILSPSKLQNVTVAHSGPTTGKKKEVTKVSWTECVRFRAGPNNRIALLLPGSLCRDVDQGGTPRPIDEESPYTCERIHSSG